MALSSSIVSFFNYTFVYLSLPYVFSCLVNLKQSVFSVNFHWFTFLVFASLYFIYSFSSFFFLLTLVLFLSFFSSFSYKVWLLMSFFFHLYKLFPLRELSSHNCPGWTPYILLHFKSIFIFLRINCVYLLISSIIHSLFKAVLISTYLWIFQLSWC